MTHLLDALRTYLTRHSTAIRVLRAENERLAGELRQAEVFGELQRELNIKLQRQLDDIVQEHIGFDAAYRNGRRVRHLSVVGDEA